MDNLLYDTTVFQKSRKKKVDYPSWHFIKNIERISRDENYITVQGKNLLQAIDLRSGEGTTMSISPVLSLSANGALAYDDPGRYIFYQLYKEVDVGWVHKTIHLLHSPGKAKGVYIGDKSLYLVNDKRCLFIQDGWKKDHRSPWSQLDPGIKFQKASVSKKGLFLIKGKEGLLLEEDSWYKTIRTTSYPVNGVIRLGQTFLFLTDRGLENRFGDVILREKIYDTASYENYLALLTKDNFYVLRDEEILFTEVLEMSLDFVLLEKDDILLVNSQSGQGFSKNLKELIAQ